MRKTHVDENTKKDDNKERRVPKITLSARKARTRPTIERELGENKSARVKNRIRRRQRTTHFPVEGITTSRRKGTQERRRRFAQSSKAHQGGLSGGRLEGWFSARGGAKAQLLLNGPSTRGSSVWDRKKGFTRLTSQHALTAWTAKGAEQPSVRKFSIEIPSALALIRTK